MFGNKYSYAPSHGTLAIWEESKPGVSHKIATVIPTPNAKEIAKNMVAALNARHRYLEKVKNKD